MDNLPIRYKLIIHFLLISILPSIGLGFLIGWTVDRILEREATNHTLQLIDKVNSSLDSHIENMQNITYLISFNKEVQHFFSDREIDRLTLNHYEIKKFLQGFTTLHSEIAGILIVNSRGDYLSNEMYSRTSRNLTKEKWYQSAVENKGIFTITGHPVGRNLTTHTKYKDEEVISVVRAVVDPNTQKVTGVILIDLKLRVIAQAVKDIRLGKTGYLMVVDDQGENIYSPLKPFLDKIPLEWLMEKDSGSFSKQVDQDTLQFIYRKSSFTNWTTVGVFSTNESVLEVQEINFFVISFVFFVCLFGITASFYLSYSLSKPIGHLMSIMREAKRGDLAVRYEGRRMDEIGLLGSHFNAMINQINKLISLTEQQERQKREAELKSLQAHIKPHFLYNTLDSIHWMARKKGAEDVAEVVEALSKLFRIGLSKGRDIIPLADELEHIKSYLKIQETRYKEKLRFTLHVDPEVERAYVLKLVLQPLVENAIYHGIKERRGPGHILIEAKKVKEQLHLVIQDDGKGMTEQELQGLLKEMNLTLDSPPSEAQKKSYGMINVQARMKLTWGEPYGIHIDSTYKQGTTVTIIHPLLFTEEFKQEETG